MTAKPKVLLYLEDVEELITHASETVGALEEDIPETLPNLAYSASRLRTLVDKQLAQKGKTGL